MSMSFGLGATLNTSQKLTPQMQQAIKLLQLSSLELAQEVQAKLESNPLLERIEDEEERYDEDSSDLEMAEDPLTLEMWNSGTNDNDASHDSRDGYDSYDGYDSQDSVDSFDKLQQAHIDGSAMDIDNEAMADPTYDSAYADQHTVETTSFTAAPSDQAASSPIDFDDLERYQGTTNASIQDYIRWQLNFKRLSDTDTMIADYLIDAMDEMGFIRLDIDDLLQSFATMASFYQWPEPIEYDEITVMLRVIQSCDPLGVGARNLSECLAIQLSKLDRNTEHLAEAQALLSASEHLVSNNIKALTQATGLKAAQITPALSLLRQLNPAPGLAFQSSQSSYEQAPESYDIPDVLVTPIRRHRSAALEADRAVSDERWQVSLNPETLPKLRINEDYANLVKRGDDSSDNQYLRENLSDAKLFIRSIEERNQNLLKVATSIVRRQQEFLRHGASAMQPLILKDIAEEVELHESTVSRLTTSKSILTPQGLFSLKYFFSSHVSSREGDISSTAISAMIKQLIANEAPKKPLSDSRLQQHLHAEGIDIARRTVAKYREAMGIGSSTQRKQKY
ncbi:RNA polymerase factor sigma-54 [uncultured Psychrobacter sp.]|uniref:RNA polymerase factor sigma-54 n=1 Tax=uncultured Psychrobacter sp. TaxID=259303 RepID=UPI002614597A|nr:RNA polymerase factor sigma-54 [uncultured Psychrobacter sp.]